MDNILTENVFDSKLDTCNDSNLFDCLTSEEQKSPKDGDTVENGDIGVTATLESDAILTFVESNNSQQNCDTVDKSQEINESSNDIKSTDNHSVTDTNDFVVPTIVDIRGACDDSLEPTKNADVTESPQISICHVQGGVQLLESTNQLSNEDSNIVYTIDDNDNTPVEKIQLNNDVVIKQEPRDEEDDDCILVNADDVSTCFTSEIEIKEERSSCEEEDSEVQCIEMTSQIPLPIPIKIEANFENDKEISKPDDSTKSTEDKSPAKHYTTVGYKCHLCNTTFREHELLNEHMKLHRNNILAERFSKTYSKHKKHTKYICRTCGKRLSTGQSLAQHTMIHNNEKPHVCPICKKDFRHLSNFKMHVQKHKEEEEQRRRQREKHKLFAKLHPPPADRSLARAADFGRLVGPLFVKETLLSKSTDISRPPITPKIERKSFELKYPKARDNVKENLIFYKKIASNYDESYSRARKFNDDIGDDVIPLKTFNNVENIVMNATKFIVKVDNLDANLLKKKIKTPDISIDKSALENKPPDRKRRIALSPSDTAKKIKLDQIENIIMDPSTPDDDCQIEYADDDYDDESTARTQETLTDNELFELLNDDRDDIKNLVDTKSPSKSNVIVLKNTPKPVQRFEAKEPAKPANEAKPDQSDEDDIDTKCDNYDNAFRHVALRRLMLIRKKAAQNGGKVENKYLLGPLFWRKAVRKAQRNQITNEPVMSLNDARLAYKRLNAFKFGKLDTRRTNDPAKLQQRAELKLQFVLDRIKATPNANNVNIAGPLFWKRTLKLAGIHNAKDLKQLCTDERLSIDDIEFVDTEDLPKPEVSKEPTNGEVVTIDDDPPVPEVPPPVAVSDFLENVETKTTQCVSNNDRSIVDSMLNDDLLKPKYAPSKPSSSTDTSSTPKVLKTVADSTKQSNKITKKESILFDSLTKPRPIFSPRPVVETLQKTKTASKPVRRNVKQIPKAEESKKLDTKMTPIERFPQIETPVTTSGIVVHEMPDSTTLESGNIILNVDSANFQLIADNKAQNGDETNYVLVTDENGGVQLIKENDLQLVEDEASNTHYMVNMQGENYPNFDLITDTNGEQLTYAIQLDGENYTTLQFVQDADALEIPKEKIIANDKSVTIAGTNYVIADATTDLNHIGKELSDFLHLDYGALLKPGNENQQM